MADGTPNPDNMMPDEDNPLGDIDPMEWLESLAARQGATEGFTTRHDLDIAEIDPDSVTIDEPGYAPYETFGQDTSQVQAAEETPPPAQEPAAAPQSGTDMPDDVDPLEWLETLAARQGATEGFTTQHNLDIADIDPDSVTIDEPGYTPSESFSARRTEEAPVQPEEPAMDFDFDFEEPPPAIAQEPAVAPQSGMDIPDDMDPMEFLETLAARQGATEGFLTQHDLDIAEIDPDSVTIDEPGYTPSESFSARRTEEEPAPLPEQPPATDFDFDFEEPFPAAEAPSDFRFDADTEDFLAEVGSELEPVPNFDVDFGSEPGSSPDDLSWMDGIGSSEEPEAIPPTHTPDEIMASIEGYSDEQLAQMQAQGQLSGEQEFAWLQRQALTRIEEREEDRVPDEDLPPAEAGEIPDWLQQSARVTDEFTPSAAFFEELSVPPTPEDLPDWLRDETPQPEAGATSDMELPDFTVEAADAPSPPPEPSLEDTGPTAAAISDLKLDAYDPSQDEWAEALDEEHERMESGVVEDAGWLRDAMDTTDQAEPPAPPPAAPEPEPEETTVPEPEWLAEVTEESPPPPPTDEIPDDLPDWLRPVAAASAADDFDEFSDIGTWLREEESGGSRTGISTQSTEPVSADATGALPPTDSEDLEQAHPGPVPAWARESAPAAPEAASPPPAAPSRPATPPPAPPRPAPPSQQPVTPPKPTPQPHRQQVVPAREPAPPPSSDPAPVPETFAQYKSRLESNPDDHEARIELARELAKSGQIEDSVPQYQTLVERKDDLNDVAEDLHSLIVSTPGHPALRRLLGDVYMRQGYLQEALDAYRGALDNL